MKSPDQALSWYEASLPLKERKRRGHFSTPPSLVERVLDACGYLPDADLADIRVLDPACGGGNFLAAAARRLLAFAGLRELDRAAQIALAQRNLWGFDPDPVACFLAEMQLRTTMEEAWQGQAWQSQETPLSECTLQVHQADGLTLPWEPRVDLFVANPPYLATKNTDLSGYQSAQQRGQADSYLFFLNCALQVVRPGGWIGMVLPDPVLARANAARERTYLLKDATIRHIWHLSGVFTAEVGAVVIIAQKCPPPSVHYVSWIRGKWQRNAGHQLIAPRAGSDKTNYGVVGTLPEGQVSRFIAGPRFITPTQNNTSSGFQMGTVLQSLFLKQPRAELRYLLGDKRGSIAEHLHSCLDEMHPLPSRLAPLGKFLSISRGEELAKESPYISPTPQPAYYPVLRGGIDIRQYKAPIGNWCISREAISKPLERYLPPKLIVVKSTDCLQAALDTRGHITLQTLYLLHLRTEINVGVRLADALDDLYFFLALLNSQVLRDYVYMLHTAYKWVQPQIEQSVLARLPVPIVEAEEREGIIELSKLLVDACSAEDTVVEWKRPIHSIYEEQEHAIRTLYASVLPGLFTLSTKESN
jgi:SAM-dependent methyltransferase